MNLKPNLFKISLSAVAGIIVAYILGEFYVLGETNFLKSIINFSLSLFLPQRLHPIFWVYILIPFLTFYFICSLIEKKTLIP